MGEEFLESKLSIKYHQFLIVWLVEIKAFVACFLRLADPR
jgi:hypothetical protein